MRIVYFLILVLTKVLVHVHLTYKIHYIFAHIKMAIGYYEI